MQKTASDSARFLAWIGCCFFMDIQFICQPPGQTKAGDKAVEGQIFGDLVFAVDDLQNRPPLRLVQPPNKLYSKTHYGESGK